MKILDFMSFNVEWFLTTQGMLITGGVLLLLIALIILLTSGKKEDDTDPTTDIASAVVANDFGINAAIPSQVEQPQVVVPEIPTLEPVAPVTPISQPEVSQPVNLGMGIADMAPMSQPVSQSPVGVVNPEPTLEQQPVVPPVLEINPVPAQPEVIAQDMPTFEPVAPVVEPTPVAPSISEINIPDPIAIANANVEEVPTIQPVVEQPVEPVQSIPQQPAVSIYGGVNPTQDIFKPAESVKPVIYGGADPLENTGAIPKVDIAPVVEQPAPEAKVVEPVVQTPLFSETAVVNNEPATVIPAAPQVEEIQSSSDEIEELLF